MGSAMYAIGCAQWFADWVLDFRNKAPVNSFHLPDEENHRLVGGDPNIRIWLGLWKLADDEALVNRGHAPRVSLLELPTRQHLGRVSRLQVSPGPHQQWWGEAARRRIVSPGGRPRGPGSRKLDGHRGSRPRHHVRPLGARRFVPGTDLQRGETRRSLDCARFELHGSRPASTPFPPRRATSRAWSKSLSPPMVTRLSTGSSTRKPAHF